MGNLGPGDTGVVHLFSDSLSSGPSEMLAALLAPASWLLTGFAALAIVLIVVLLITGPLTKNRGAIRSFYGEDRRHAPKAETGFHGFRLTLKEPVDASAVRERVLSMLKKEGSRSMLRIRLISAKQYTYSAAADADVADEMLGVASSSVHEPAGLSAVSNEMWKRGSPLMIWINGRTVDMCAHHAVFDGVRGCRLLNELLGNLGKKGAIRPDQLPCCMLACSMRTLARVFAFERPCGTLSLRAPDGHHESHYPTVSTAIVKRAKETHGLGFAPALQGLVLWALFRCGVPSTLHIASTVGFKSDWWAKLGSAFNHYGAFPFAASDAASPHDVGKAVARQTKRNGFVSGFPCLLGNMSSGGMTNSIAKMYKAIGAPRPSPARRLAARRPACACLACCAPLAHPRASPRHAQTC